MPSAWKLDPASGLGLGSFDHCLLSQWTMIPGGPGSTECEPGIAVILRNRAGNAHSPDVILGDGINAIQLRNSIWAADDLPVLAVPVLDQPVAPTGDARTASHSPHVILGRA